MGAGRALVVVGVGVNLEAPDDVPGAGAIGDVDPEALLTAFLRRLRALVDGHTVRDPIGRGARSPTRSVAHVDATTVGGAIARGVAVDLDETGALLVDSTDGPSPAWRPGRSITSASMKGDETRVGEARRRSSPTRPRLRARGRSR